MITLFWLKALFTVRGAFYFGANLKLKRLLNMIILQESGSAQEVKFVARKVSGEHVTGSAGIRLCDEVTNAKTTASVTLFKDRYYTYFSAILTDLKEDRHFMLTVTYQGTEIFYGKIFVTNQTVSDYSINNGVFTERSTSNEYTIFDG